MFFFCHFHKGHLFLEHHHRVGLRKVQCFLQATNCILKFCVDLRKELSEPQINKQIHETNSMQLLAT